LSTRVAYRGCADPITLPILSQQPVAAGVDTNLGRWLTGNVKPNAEAVTKATELLNSSWR
jgi:hypothetical protein